MSSLKQLKALANKTKAHTQERHDVRMAKKEARQKAKKDSDLLASIDAGLTDCGHSNKKVITSNDVEQWFREALEENFGSELVLPEVGKWWGLKQKSLAKKLLATYGPELVGEAVLYLCENWKTMETNSEGRLQGVPTIEFLFSTRERILNAVNRGQECKVAPKRRNGKLPAHERHDGAEYVESENVGIGWGDD